RRSSFTVGRRAGRRPGARGPATPAGPAADGFVDFPVTIDTSALAGTTGFLDFQFNPGALPDAQAANVSLTNFTTSGGGATGAIQFLRDASGTLSRSLAFDNSTPPNAAEQQVTFGRPTRLHRAIAPPPLAPP